MHLKPISSTSVLYLCCFFSGSCSVSPAEGEAVRTKFTVSCSKWEDADLPLSYEFSYSADGNSSNSVCISKSPTCTTVLGPGKEENDFKVYLKTKIFDRFKGYTEFVVTAKVSIFILGILGSSLQKDRF